MDDVKYISNLISGEDIYYLKDAEARTNLADKISKEEYAEGVVVDSTRYYTVTGAEKEYWNSKVNPPSYSAPTAKNLTYTGEAQTLLNAGSSTVGTIQYSEDETNWSTSIPQATNAGTYTVYWKFAGSEIVYVDSTAINVTIAKANPTYTAPTAKTLTYNGNAQDLVNAGTTNAGIFKYGFAPEQYIDPTNGHEYVDLGLPSGTKWATMNVGANTETDYGNYYMYGKGSSTYDSSDFPYEGMENQLSLSLDTARQVMGGNWRMPTDAQLRELTENTTYEWTTIDGVNGGKFTAQNGNYVFIPAAGEMADGDLYYSGSQGYVWSSSPYGPMMSSYLWCFSHDGPVRLDFRQYGFSVRGVTSLLPQGTDVDTYTVYWKLEGDENHNDVTGTVEVTITKVTPTVTAPTAKTWLVYDELEHELVSPGSTNFGGLQYSLDDLTYSPAIPYGTNAGDYTVYYKVVGDSNVNNVAAQSVSCSIAKGTPTVTAPTAKSLTYNGLAQELVNAGVSDFGTIKYSLGVPQQVINNNGHAYVDLGLPSGTLWATMNVGANAPEDYGNYYMYGKGATVYNSSDSRYGGTEDPLSLSVDTARQVWNGDWHIPTKAQLEELNANTTFEFTTINGVNGGKFTAQNGNYIFIPAAGYWLDGDHDGVGSSVWVWSSSPYDSSHAYILVFDNTENYISPNTYEDGFSMRGVIDGASTIYVPSTYSSSIPTGTNAGTYYVYWKIEGDDNINEVSGSTAIEVTISKINSTITMSGNNTNMTPGQTNTLTISVAGGATPTITSSNTSVATVSGYTITTVGGGTTTITISTLTDDNHNGDTVTYMLTSAWPNGIYAAYADGSMRTAANADTNAIGVAVITDNCSFIIDKGNETKTYWDNSLRTNGIISGCFTTNDADTAKTDYNGASNTDAIAAVASGGEAAKHCKSCSKTIGGVTKYGYLGACGEWNTAYTNKTDIDSMMSAIGGTALHSDGYYWSSTLLDIYADFSYYSWCLTWDIGSFGVSYRYSSLYVRPLYTI